MKPKGRVQSFCEWALALAAAPVLLPLLVVSGFQTWLLPSELWMRYALFRRGRHVSLRQLHDHSRAGRGTIIYDVASANGGYIRIWWTEDDVRAVAPAPPLSDEQRFRGPGEPLAWHEFDRWVTEKYLDAERGKARLVQMLRGRNDPSGLRARFPGCKLLCSYSGGREAGIE